MTIEQRKISLINWITNLTEESLIIQMERFRRESLEELPRDIVTLLEKSDTAREETCIEHTTARKILGRE